MRKLVLGVALLTAIVPLSAASSAILTLGGPLAHLCYQDAVGEDGRASAVEACTRALQEQSLTRADRVATLVNRGIVLMNGGRFEEAEGDFDAALASNPRVPDGWLNKAFLRLRQGDGQAALPLIQRALDEGAQNGALVTFARGVAHEQAGEAEAAYADFTRASRLAPAWSLPRMYLSSYRPAQR